MTDFSPRLSELLSEHENLNFRLNEEQDFPWGHNIAGVWYSLTLWEDRFPKYYGFSSSKTSKQDLLEVLNALLGQHTRHQLLGVWTGEFTTHLFLLKTEIAIEEISYRQKLSARELAESSALHERNLERKKQERKDNKPQRITSSKPSAIDDFNDFGSLIRALQDEPDDEPIDEEII